jgi:hypothetical protein
VRRSEVAMKEKMCWWISWGKTSERDGFESAFERADLSGRSGFKEESRDSIVKSESESSSKRVEVEEELEREKRELLLFLFLVMRSI